MACNWWHRFWRVSNWNKFDFFVICSNIVLIPFQTKMTVLRLLRLLRILRVLRITHKLAPIRMIVVMISRALKPGISIVGLMFGTISLYAVMAVQIFHFPEIDQ